MRRTQCTLNKAMRELDKERQKLKVPEKRLVTDIRKSAREGKLVRFILVSHLFSLHTIGNIERGACKVMAKDLIRTCRYNQ